MNDLRAEGGAKAEELLHRGRVLRVVEAEGLVVGAGQAAYDWRQLTV